MEELNLHLTGDVHAIGAAHNLAAAFIDNHAPPRRRARDRPEPRSCGRASSTSATVRCARSSSGWAASRTGYARSTQYVITVGSEVMAILALASDIHDLVGRDQQWRPAAGTCFGLKPCRQPAQLGRPLDVGAEEDHATDLSTPHSGQERGRGSGAAHADHEPLADELAHRRLGCVAASRGSRDAGRQRDGSRRRSEPQQRSRRRHLEGAGEGVAGARRARLEPAREPFHAERRGAVRPLLRAAGAEAVVADRGGSCRVPRRDRPARARRDRRRSIPTRRQSNRPAARGAPTDRCGGDGSSSCCRRTSESMPSRFCT